MESIYNGKEMQAILKGDGVQTKVRGTAVRTTCPLSDEEHFHIMEVCLKSGKVLSFKPV